MGSYSTKIWRLLGRELAAGVHLWNILLMFIALGLSIVFLVWGYEVDEVGVFIGLSQLVGLRPRIVEHPRWFSRGLVRGQSRAWFAGKYLQQILIFSAVNGLFFVILVFAEGYVYQHQTSFLGFLARVVDVKIIRAFLLGVLVAGVCRCAAGCLYLTRTSTIYPNWMRCIGMNERFFVLSVRGWLSYFGVVFFGMVLFSLPLFLSGVSKYYYWNLNFVDCLIIGFGFTAVLYAIFVFFIARASEVVRGPIREHVMPFRLWRGRTSSNIPNKSSTWVGLCRITPSSKAKKTFIGTVLFSMMIFGFLVYDTGIIPFRDPHWLFTMFDHLLVSASLFLCTIVLLGDC